MRKITNIILILLITIYISSCNLNYLDYEQHIESPNGRDNYSLYYDNVGLGDPGYYVLKLEKSIDPKKLHINWNSKNGTKIEDLDWIEKRQVLFNYDEAGFFTSNAKIEIIDNRFLVLSRGGYYFGLYDIKLQKDTFNIASPWNEWRDGSGYRGEKYDKDSEQKEYGQWIKVNINDKILDYIQTNK